MFYLNSFENQKRMSTQDLLLRIAEQVAQGETQFTIAAQGQHDLGGPLWNKDGTKLQFWISNPGQRVGAMALSNTEIVVQGSAPADVGWLNAGGEITVLGDCGDTAGHSAAEGKIYIAGRAGTRSGSLMKKDPTADDPELWIYKSTGSFSFEFMLGGKAVICGMDVDQRQSVLGDRPCIGMVGGTVYVRGKIPELTPEVCVKALNADDESFLRQGLPQFLAKINQISALDELSKFSLWQKIVPNQSYTPVTRRSLQDFRLESWISGGIFQDVFPDKFASNGLVARGIYRLRVPIWRNNLGAAPKEKDKRVNSCRDCRICAVNCPEAAISREVQNEQVVYTSNAELCIGCGICVGVCPEGIWVLEDNFELKSMDG
ncbi:MAG: 4Fe-4S binding protein [Desulfovibrionaceae bacterium]|nr:4Fe-4S binding protein [Desulfovibrionaceae bacterium]